MIIPVRCVTCGNVLANKYRYYQEKVRERKISKGEKLDNVVYFSSTNTEKTAEGETLDELRLTNVCCRRHMLTHVDIE
jgi:DNA-directed RNA polymerase I, II, and III subunit RPABC5